MGQLSRTERRYRAPIRLRGALLLQRAGLHRRQATASWTDLFRMIKLLSSSSTSSSSSSSSSSFGRPLAREGGHCRGGFGRLQSHSLAFLSVHQLPWRTPLLCSRDFSWGSDCTEFDGAHTKVSPCRRRRRLQAINKRLSCCLFKD